MADIGITKFRVQIPRGGATPSTPGFAQSEGQDPVNPPGSPTGIYVPYLGATGAVNLGEYGLTTGNLVFDTTPTNIPTAQGAMYWDADDETVALIMNGAIQKIGEDSFYQVKNQTGSNIAKGVAVRFAGTVGNSGRLLIAPFLADGTYPSTYFMGVTMEAIPNGEDGKVMWFGRIRGINTNAYNEGDILYASTTVAGGFQTTVPVAPNNIVEVCAVVTKSATVGTIFVRPTLGSNINRDEGVKITSPTTGDLLQLQSGGLWENKSVATVMTNYVSYNTADSKNATEKNQARVNIGSTSSTPQVITTAGAINNLAVTSNSLVFTGASVVLSGIVAGLDGEELAILNASGTNLELLSQSTLSTAGNRFASGVIVPNLSIVRIKYRTTTARWVLENVGINDNRYVRKDVNDTKINRLIFDWTAGNLNENHIEFKNSITTAYALNVLGGGTHTWDSWGNSFTGYNFNIAGTLRLNSQRNTLSSEGGGAGNYNNWTYTGCSLRIVSGGHIRVEGGLGAGNAKGSLLFRGYDSTPTLQFSVFSTGRVEHSKSGDYNESVRRDELYLNYSQTVATAGTLNNLAINSDCKLLILTGCDDLTGVVFVDSTRLLRIEARGANRVIRDQNVGSNAANRFALGADLTINDGEVYQFIYTNDRWRRVL